MFIIAHTNRVQYVFIWHRDEEGVNKGTLGQNQTQIKMTKLCMKKFHLQCYKKNNALVIFVHLFLLCAAGLHMIPATTKKKELGKETMWKLKVED